MTENIKSYFEALERLTSNQPINVPKGTKISNDSVALEAGRTKGSIKKSRKNFEELVRAIKAAALIQNQDQNSIQKQLRDAKNLARKYRTLYEESIAREISLLDELHTVRKELAVSSRGNLISLQKR